MLTCLMRNLFVEQTQSQGFSELFQVQENRVCCGIPPEGSLSSRRIISERLCVRFPIVFRWREQKRDPEGQDHRYRSAVAVSAISKVEGVSVSTLATNPEVRRPDQAHGKASCVLDLWGIGENWRKQLWRQYLPEKVPRAKTP